jgi:hypothetical protein
LFGKVALGVLFSLLWLLANSARANQIFNYGPVTEPILSASLDADLAALTANRTLFGTEVNSVQLMRPGYSVLDLSDAFFGSAEFPDTPQINMGPLETGLVSVPIPPSFFPALASGSMGYQFLFTDTDDGLFAIDFLALSITTASGTLQSLLDTNNGFGIGIADGGLLPAPLPEGLTIGASGSGFDEAITSKALQASVPEPGTTLLLLSGLFLLWYCNRGHSAAVPGLVLVASLMGVAHADHCPPAAGDAQFGKEPKDVPGKPGEKGWLVEDTQVDDKGNKIERWCLRAGNGHGGPDFAWLWKAKGVKDADAVWIGACLFPRGQNKPNKGFVDVNTVGRPNGKPDEFKQLTWFNAEPPPAGTNDWDYSFDTATGKLTVNKTKGQYVVVRYVVVDGTGRPVGVIESLVYQTTQVVGTDTYDAPKAFKDLKFQGQQIAALFPGPDGVAGEALAALGRMAGNRWSYTLRVNDMGGSGTESDPFIGTEAALQAGDTFTIAATGIQNPLVSDEAKRPEYGAWVVEQYDSSFVTFRATTSATFVPGVAIPGFGFSSSAPPGKLFWNVASSNEAIGSSGIVAGPAALPDQLHIVGPVPNRIAVGQAAAISANVQAKGSGVPAAEVTFTSLAGNLVFTDGTVAPDGKTATTATDGNGVTQMGFTPLSAGRALIKASVRGTNLNAYSLIVVQ